jgi:DNA-binding response OmpR family regulator
MPDLILLDLNMPKKDGIESLKEIKSNKKLKCIPVIVLTTSSAEEDIIKTYNLGVNSFITKPVTFEGLVKVIKEIDNYWFELVKLPSTNNNR